MNPRSLIVITAVLACVIGPTVSARAASEATLVNAYSGQCLDAHTNGTVFTDKCDGFEQQQWYVSYNLLDKAYEFQNVYSGQCLDAHTNGSVFTDTCDGFAQQDW